MDRMTNDAGAQINRGIQSLGGMTGEPMGAKSEASGYSPHYIATQLEQAAQKYAEGDERNLLIGAAKKLASQDREIASMRGALAEGREELTGLKKCIEMAQFALAARVYPS